jgi:hypothetical protein
MTAKLQTSSCFSQLSVFAVVCVGKKFTKITPFLGAWGGIVVKALFY